MKERKKLVLAEDNEDMLRLLQRRLEKHHNGLEVISTSTYSGAIDLIVEHRGSIDILVSDFHFVEARETGMDILHFASLHCPHALLFVVSSHDQESVFDDYAALGKNVKYFSKSRLREFDRAIEQVVRGA